MTATLRALGTTLLLAILTSCATARPMNMPCEDCVEGVTYVKKQPERHAFCVVNGYQVDCTKNPPECPKCAQAVRRQPSP